MKFQGQHHCIMVSRNARIQEVGVGKELRLEPHWGNKAKHSRFQSRSFAKCFNSTLLLVLKDERETFFNKEKDMNHHLGS